MKQLDTRKLGSESRNFLRQLVVRLREHGMRAADIAQVAGAHPSTIRAWLAKAKRKGDASLDEKRRGRPLGACRKLTAEQEIWIREQIVGGSPQQVGLPFALWNRPAIRALVKEKFELDLQDRLIGKYLKRWGFTAQRPTRHAMEQRPEEVKRWLSVTYPALVEKAKRESAQIHWGDETAVKEDGNWIRGYAPKGETPVLSLPTKWEKLSMISTISARGEVSFWIIDGSINADLFIEFLTALVQDARHKIILVVDNLRVHHSLLVRKWLSDKKDKIELAFLPPYSPESNPDEYLNRDFKTALRSGRVSTNSTSLREKATVFMKRLKANPEKVAAYFRHPLAAYALSYI